MKTINVKYIKSEHKVEVRKSLNNIANVFKHINNLIDNTFYLKGE